MNYKPIVVLGYFLEMGLPEPVFEHVYIPCRKFRLDIAFPAYKVGLEVQGGLWFKAAHSTGKGIKRDMEKRNLGILHGWDVVECEPCEVCMLETVELLRTVLRLHGRK
jgi:hypothetical protein